MSSNNLACNGPPNPTTPSSKIIQVTAGSNLTAIWRHTLTCKDSSSRNIGEYVADIEVAGPGDVMDASHKGPTLAYMKKVTDATKDSGVGNGW